MGLSELRVPRAGGNHAPTACKVDCRKPGRLRYRSAFLLAERLLVPVDTMGKDRPQIFAGKGRTAKAESCLQHAAGRTLDDGTGTDRQILSGIAMWYKPEELVGKTLVAIVNLPPRKMMGLESNGMLISAVHTEKGEEQLNLLMIDDKIPAGAKMC